MSSVESLISEIDQEYWKLRNLIEETLTKVEETKANLSEKEAINLFHQCVKFQRVLESRQAQVKIFSGVAHYERASTKFSAILETVTTHKVLEVLSGSYGTGYQTTAIQSQIAGLVKESREFISFVRKEAAPKWTELSLKGITDILRNMQLDLIELFEDVRLMSGMTYFTVEQRSRVHDDLFKMGFKDALGFLDDAEANLRLEKPHLKDSLHNCRLAIESVVYTIAKKENVIIKNKFSVDLSELSQKNESLVDIPTKTMLQGASNYLSVTGSHVYGKVDKDSVELVEQGFNQTYIVLEHLMGRLRKLDPDYLSKSSS